MRLLFVWCLSIPKLFQADSKLAKKAVGPKKI
jgi:hypothetical protein